jgi:pyruvate formate lyase activating enzyme
MERQALIFDIKRDCSEDGPGIRTTVFFKGCPLSCVWCQNPEGIEKQPGLSFDAGLCHPDSCGTSCISACSQSCFSLMPSGVQVHHAQCNRCDRCFSSCPTGALEPAGYWITLDDLLYRVAIDKPFYHSSGGGVTLSGGEATMQTEFAHHFLKALKDDGIHTAIETSGFFNYRRFSQQLLPWLDLIYFDLKLINDVESRRYTGQSNRLILDNFVQLARQSVVPVIPRVPLVPGITTTEENLRAIAGFLNTNGISAATLLPYNPLWQDKAEKLGRAPLYQCSTFLTQDEKQACVTSFYPSQQENRRFDHAN